MADRLREEIREAFARQLRQNAASPDLETRISAAIDTPRQRYGWVSPVALTCGLLVLAGATVWLLQLRQHATQPTGLHAPVAASQPVHLSASASPSATPGGPSPRGGAAMAWDSAHHNAVLFGGGGQGDTWLWNGVQWSLRQPGTSPSPRSSASMAYDAGRQRIVLFGGSYTADTWEWDGTNWNQLRPAMSPPPTEEAPMVYDSALKRVVLLDGGTWTWDGSTWTKLPAATPGSGIGANSGLAYDAARHVVVLCVQGKGALDAAPFETWLFDGSTWKQVSIGSGPPMRSLPAFVYDGATQTSLLYGGASMNLNDTWVWNGSSWRELHPATSPPHLTGSGPNPASTYDPDRGLVLLFGGYSYDSAQYLNTMWAWNGTTWSKLPQPAAATATSSSPTATVDLGPITTRQSYAPGIRLEVPLRAAALTVSEAQARCGCIADAAAQQTELAMFNDDEMTTNGVLVYQNVLAYVYIWKNGPCVFLGPGRNYPSRNTCNAFVFINADTGEYLLQVQN